MSKIFNLTIGIIFCLFFYLNSKCTRFVWVVWESAFNNRSSKVFFCWSLALTIFWFSISNVLYQTFSIHFLWPLGLFSKLFWIWVQSAKSFIWESMFNFRSSKVIFCWSLALTIFWYFLSNALFKVFLILNNSKYS